ncbi:dolichyl-phosphate-mannose--protein mannosyltransferase [Acaricomes phytoseiuli]|uniref:dolichyl-phosphate-mannose--protein mannosyltransferase n=1 Tax=Acaricomes phytoseiuli TaxID=291968 RepID=UPI0003A536C4
MLSTTGTIGMVSQDLRERGAAGAKPRTARGAWLSSAEQALSLSGLQKRLGVGGPGFRALPPGLRLWFWLGPLLTAVLGGILRFWRLGEPRTLVFDETYYVKDAYSYLVSGYERAWGSDPNAQFAAGDFSELLPGPGYVVHPPVGKWLIAAGMQLFGPESSFGWRFSTALVGTIAVLVVALIAQKLFRSTLLGIAAGLLMAVDGQAIVMSRTALLDNYVMFFALLAFGALLLDRDDGRRRLARRLSAQLSGATGEARAAKMLYGPFLGLRWWRIAAGVCLGLSIGSKWSGLFFLAAFGLMSVLWDASARRQAGIRRWFTGAFLKDSPLAFLSVVPVAALTYLASWKGWLLSSDAYNRNWAASNPAQGWEWVPDSLRSLWAYHQAMYTSGVSITSEHPYSANAWSWLVMGRPTSFFAQYPSSGCSADRCAQVVNSVGNPLIWWSGTAALLFLVGYWILRRDWRAAAILCGWAAGYLPWLLYPERTIFFFYVIAYTPYMILALVFCLGLLLGPREAPPWRRQQGTLFLLGFLILAVLISAFFMSIWTAEVINYEEWRSHMWMPSWV